MCWFVDITLAIIQFFVLLAKGLGLGLWEMIGQTHINNSVVINYLVSIMNALVPCFGIYYYDAGVKMLRDIFIEHRVENMNVPVVRSIVRLEKPFTFLHNLALAVFSGWVFVCLQDALMTQGFVFRSMYWFEQNKIDNIVWWFYVSKYWEFIDTFILVVRGKEPSFLQKFHHVGAVLTWHFCYNYKIDAIIYGTWLNSFVHLIMYLYFCLSSVGIRLSAIRPIITSVQLIQFVAGNLIATVCYVPPIESWNKYAIILCVDCYLVGLMYLFGRFFCLEYVGGGGAVGKTEI